MTEKEPGKNSEQANQSGGLPEVVNFERPLRTPDELMEALGAPAIAQSGGDVTPVPETKASDTIAAAEVQSGVDPDLRTLIENPDALSPKERQRIVEKAEVQAAWESAKHRVVVMDKTGQPYWGAEFPSVFAFNGQMRGKFGRVPKDRDKWTPGMQAAGLSGERAMGGAYNTVIIAFDDGEKVVVRKKNEAISADAQQFEIISTSRSRKNGEISREDLPSELLDGVIVVPGEPLVLGADASGKRMRSRGLVTKITAMEHDDNGLVPSNHPHLQKAEKQRNTLNDFRADLVEATGRTA